MGRIDCLIFSKNRGAQLDLLLRSVDLHAAGLYRSLTVLWTVSDPAYVKGYRRCRELHDLTVGLGWWQQLEAADDFEPSVRVWLDAVGVTVSFLVDDDVFYRDAAEPDELPWSYRGGDYGYPFSLDGNVYAKADVVKLLDGLRFTDPTELEHQGHLHRDRLPFEVVNFGEPCLVGIPANRVSASSGMPHMGIHEYDLNERFLAGERLQLPVVDEDLPAHANIELVFG